MDKGAGQESKALAGNPFPGIHGRTPLVLPTPTNPSDTHRQAPVTDGPGPDGNRIYAWRVAGGTGP